MYRSTKTTKYDENRKSKEKDTGHEDFEDAVVDLEKGDIEGSSSEIVDNDAGLTTLLVETVGDRGSGGLVEDTEDKRYY